MKKTIISTLCLLGSMISFSQYKGGMEVGGNLMNADFSFGEPLETGSTWGIRLGYVAEYGISDQFYFRGDC